MKAQKFKFGILFIFIVALGLTTAYTIQDEFTKKYHEEFDTNENTELIIQNKYGEVDIKDWDKNLIEIDVVITVEHPDKERAERILSMFSVEFSQEGNTIKAITKINEKFHKPLSKLTLGYGKAIIEEVNWLKTDIKYSKMEIEKSKALVIVSKYSKIYVNEGSSIVAESKYDTYDIGHVTNFVCESGYTNYEFFQIICLLFL
ncbi:hypothetical protein ES708_30677 [subsurface metagenome]